MSASPAAAFLQSLVTDLTARRAADDRLAPFLDALGTVDYSAQRYERAERFEHTSMRYLDPALDTASGVPALVDAVRQVAHSVHWYQIFQGGNIDKTLTEGLLAAQVAGPVGMVSNDTLRCGLFLLAPGLHYPLHTHAASEIYYCLSGALELAYGLGKGSFQLLPGALSVTPSHRLHSLTTGASPVLLIYLWTGPVDEPNWWWEKRQDGIWQRTKWVRTPDASWKRSESERVTDTVMRAALGG